MMPLPPTGQAFSFDADLESWAEGMDYCAVAVPADITQAMGSKGPVLVLARVNESAPFQVSLFPVGGGRHCIRIKAKVRQETRTQTGDRVQLRFTVLDRESLAIPDDLQRALQGEGLAAAFAALPPGRQNFLICRMDEAARPATRARRIQEALQVAQQNRDKQADQRGRS